MECIFCQIIKGQLPSYKIYEDDNVVAFLSIRPVSPGHILVVPKKHFANLLTADQETISQSLAVLQKLAPKILVALAADGFNLGVNNGAAAGQEIEHLHFHLIPRVNHDGLIMWPSQEGEQAELAALAEKIKSNL
jgi:histidine triad (HIT) family protein